MGKWEKTVKFPKPTVPLDYQFNQITLVEAILCDRNHGWVIGETLGIQKGSWKNPTSGF